MNAIGATRCCRCGGEARVAVLLGYQSNHSVAHDLCLICADAGSFRPIQDVSRAPRRISLGTTLALAGAGLGLLSFGWDGVMAGLGQLLGMQSGLVAIGALLVLIGALLRADVIALAGTAAFVVGLAAEILLLQPTPGLGWKQQVGLSLAVGLMLWGGIVRRLDSRRDGH